ncbi:MAG: PEP-CTERM sorting domain-containing protein [Fimbriimonadaceae bacterium]|nr:PEP-CTERM sorting domain-containing protein [Fimbriimonadaceae bacterium]
MKRILAAALVLSPLSSFATVYDAHTDFSLATNPNGVWSYGYANTLGGSFTSFDQTSTGSYDRWFTGIDSLGVYDTVSGVTFSTLVVPAAQLWMHPGPNAQYAVLRFTAPTTATYNLSAGFFGVDNVGPTTTDVHVSHNNVLVFSGVVNSFSSSPTTGYVAPLSLSAGDTVDVAVGTNGNGYVFDSTAVNLSLESVPEPTSLLALGGLALLVRRRKG